MEGTASTVSTQALVALAERSGLARAQILGDAPVDPIVLGDPTARVRFLDVLAIWERADVLSNEPLGLRAASELPFGAYRVIDFLCWSSPTVRDGVFKLARYMPLLNEAVQMTIDEAGDPVAVTLHAPFEIPVSYAAFVFAAMIVRQRVVHTEPLELAAVQFKGPPPADIAEYEASFQCAVRFDAPAHQLRLTHKTWESPLRPSEPELYATLVEHAERLMDAHQSSDLSSRVERAIAEELQGGDASLERVAKRLAMSERSLQRHLKEAGTSFASLLEARRATAARRYLERGDFSVHEVGHLLGFSGPSSFSRAFKRWTGMTPGKYRSEHGSAQ